MQKQISSRIFLLGIMLSSFSYYSLGQTTSKKVIYAIASKEIKCKSGNAAYPDKTDIEIQISQGSGDYNTEVQRLKTTLENQYKESGVTIRTNSTYGKIVVIIKYVKTNVYDCKPMQYSIGSGNTFDEALESAKRTNSVGNKPYTIVRTINNN